MTTTPETAVYETPEELVEEIERLRGQAEALKARVYDADQAKDQANKDADAWHLAYDTLCSDLAYEMGMDSPSIAGDHQVKARVKELVAESARSYSQGVEDMREKAARVVTRHRESPETVLLAAEIRDVPLSDPHGGEEAFPGSIAAAEAALDGAPAVSARWTKTVVVDETGAWVLCTTTDGRDIALRLTGGEPAELTAALTDTP